MLAVKIIAPTGLYLEGECEAIHATTVEGEMTLLPSHMPVVAMLATSKLSLKRDGDYKHYAVAGGMLHLHRDQVNILTDAIEGEKEIDLKRAEAAKERALKRLEKKDSATNIRRAEVALEKAINRIRVANH